MSGEVDTLGQEPAPAHGDQLFLREAAVRQLVAQANLMRAVATLMVKADIGPQEGAQLAEAGDRIVEWLAGQIR
jgi:hypothetical protein